MKNRVQPFLGKYKLVAASLLLVVAGTAAVVFSLRPAKASPPRVVLDVSAGDLTIGLGFSPDGPTLAFEARSGSGVTLWDLTCNREQFHLPGGSRPLVFSSDSRTLATAFDQSIRFWDAATGKEKATTHGRPVHAISEA